MSKCIFIGPTSVGINHDLFNDNNIAVLPPVKRGDIEKFKNIYSDMIIVDGYFQRVPAVGHIEIRDALNNGNRITGCSSMGAIRAYEMRGYGMSGCGWVYNKFANSNYDFTDDEVTHLHLDREPYIYITEPLVNIRYYLKQKISQGYLNKNDVDIYIGKEKNKSFHYRKLDALVDFMTSKTSASHEEILIDFKKNRIKQIDVIKTLEEHQYVS